MMIIRYLLFLGALFAAVLLPAQTRHTDLQTGKMGFLDAKGDTVVPVEYDFLPWKYAPRMIARKGDLRGVIDGAGNTLVPIAYRDIRFEKNGFFAVAIERNRRIVWGLLNAGGEMVLEVQYDFVAVLNDDLLAARLVNNMVSICDAKGQLLFKAEGEGAMPGFDNRSVLIRKADRSTYWTDLEGNVIASPQFANTIWSDGTYFIRRDSLGLLGVSDARGATVLPFRYRSIEPLHPGHFAVTDSQGLNFLLDAAGKELAQGEYIRWGKEPDAAYSRRWGIPFSSQVLDASGKRRLAQCSVYPVINHYTDRFPENFYLNYNWIELKKKQGKRALYYADGTKILPPKFINIQYCTDRHPLAAFEKDKKNKRWEWALYDFQGKRVLKQGFFGLDFTVDPRIFIVKEIQDGLWGFMHLAAPEKTAYLYDRIEPRSGGRYAGFQGMEEVLLSATGEVLEKEATVSSSPGRLEPPAIFDAPAKKETYEAFEVGKMPSFPGGEDALLTYLAGQMKYPAIAQENGVEGQVIVTFIVEKDGSITQEQIIRDIGGGCGLEALRLVRSMPRWEPGMVNGESVRVKYTLPVRFELE